MAERRCSLLNQKVRNILICPNCKSALIETKVYFECAVCLARYYIIKGIPRFVFDDDYVDSFSFEWDKHRTSLLDSASGLTRAEDMFFERTGFTKEEIKGKLILDAGCGMGRFVEVVKKYGGDIVGIDLSYAVEAAKANTDADIIQADILNLPFKENSFDYVFSIGVIHHTADTRKAFECLSRLVKPGGKLAVWVYSNDGWKFKIYNFISNFYRIFTTRMPQKLLYKLSYIAIPMYYLNKIPIVGLVFRALFPMSMEKIPEWRVLDTFDWYSPKYQTKHTYKEVLWWFYRCGFTNVYPLKVPVSVKGTKNRSVV
jgi:SAM-dependent methyltransferase